AFAKLPRRSIASSVSKTSIVIGFLAILVLSDCSKN
ncbi:MAG: hypothetical protein ACI9B9_000785, partial [Halioglobus sp.]